VVKGDDRRHIGHGPVAILFSLALGGLIAKLIRAGGRSLWTLGGLVALFLLVLIALALRGQTSKEQ
jgi:hypothetical protein